MGRNCAVAGCSNSAKTGHTQHAFPKDDRQRNLWVRFVKLTRVDFTVPTKHSAICSEHFSEECYEVDRLRFKELFGLSAHNGKRLLPGSVPSIYPKRSSDVLNEEFLTERKMKLKTSKALQKREKARRLEKCVVAKEELEKDLYSKFAAVLNSKKEKIRQLKQSEGRSVHVNDSEPGPSKITTQAKKRPAKDNSDEDHTTDDEAGTQKRKRTEAKDRSFDDDSLVLDDNEDEEKTTVVARPKRNRGANKKTTPAKPVLPKVSSKGSNASISEKPSTSRASDRPTTSRKTRGSSSNTSYDNDPDAMLDEI